MGKPCPGMQKPHPYSASPRDGTCRHGSAAELRIESRGWLLGSVWWRPVTTEFGRSRSQLLEIPSGSAVRWKQVSKPLISGQ